ncbi:MAG TPA: hypothetical protein VF644_18165 [Pyrinomonadaceae bacterium]|jgi:hypothetical protein
MAATDLKAATETAGDKNCAESHSRHKKHGEGFLRFRRLITQSFLTARAKNSMQNRFRPAKIVS